MYRKIASKSDQAKYYFKDNYGNKVYQSEPVDYRTLYLGTFHQQTKEWLHVYDECLKYYQADYKLDDNRAYEQYKSVKNLATRYGLTRKEFIDTKEQVCMRIENEK